MIRSFGLEELRQKIRHHLNIAANFEEKVQQSVDFDLMAPVPLNTVCFRYHPVGIEDDEKLNKLNKKLLSRIQDQGQFFLTHTKLGGCFTIRAVLGNTRLEQRHADELWMHLRELSQTLVS